MPLTPPPDKGATPSACHWRCWSSGIATTLGSDAHATPLHNNATTPALFHPGVGQDRASERRNGCAWVRPLNTPPVMPIQG
jgi:hypothetical protein